MNNKIYAYAGAALLVFGLFTPIISAPFVGTVSLFANGANLVAWALLALALIAAWLTFKARGEDLIWPAAGAALVVANHFVSLQLHLAQLRASFSKSLEGNPFAGIAQGAFNSIQIQWGWIILAAGAGLLVYAGLNARKAAGVPLLSAEDRLAKGVVAASAVLFVLAAGLDWSGGVAPLSGATPTLGGNAVTSSATPSADTNSAPSPEEAAYIAQNLTVYDLKAKYYDSLVDGRVPGVNFKIKNNGNRTLNEVDVRVVFYDSAGKPIGEENYSPVLVTQSSFEDDNKPLRPNYIWQNDPDKFYTAKSVPSEWQTGKVSATITNIEFAPQ